MLIKKKALTKAVLKRLRTPVQATKAARLIYINDSVPGIQRMSSGDAFTYYYRNRPVTDERTLNRIKSLVIPPAWKSVWICPKPNGHIQATGIDAANRKQYRYHPSWNLLRNHTKFSQLYEFGRTLPAIRKKLNKDLSSQGLNFNKVLAAAVSVMQCTCIRVGKNLYEKLYGSFGLTTLKDRHVKIDGAKVQFSFIGKKGIPHTLSLKSKKLASIIKQCRDIPGKELFQYYDSNGIRHSIDSGMVNNYIKELSGGNFTAKDFRTWAGTLQCYTTLKEFGQPKTETETKQKIVEAIDIVAKHLGNTRAVCRKYYIHPSVLECYTNKKLDKYTLADDFAIDEELSKEEAELIILLEKAKLSIEV